VKVVDLLDQRRENWRELETLCTRCEGRRRSKLDAETSVHFASLYRGTCADLALADAYHLPPNTVNYLHQLVGRAHNQLYRNQGFNVGSWFDEIFDRLPRRLFHDGYLRLAFVLFWGFFLASMYLGYASDGFAERVVGEEELHTMEEMHADSAQGRDVDEGIAAVGMYIKHNTSIGLWCFAFGLLFGVGGIFITISNAVGLGTVFGHMATLTTETDFWEFVTAHGPFELTGIVVMSAAGMRLGFSIVSTGGYTRGESLRRAGRESFPTIILGMFLFGGAAVIEGLISPSTLPYWTKALVATTTSALLVFYFVLLGQRSGD
jgi:uncharacterized membrane protein SpoIIM required for sporulation